MVQLCRTGQYEKYKASKIQYSKCASIEPSLVVLDSSPKVDNNRKQPKQAGHETEELIAEALGKLSIKDREDAYFEMHGVAEIPNETEDFVNKKCDMFQQELDKIRNNKNVWTRTLPISSLELAESRIYSFARDKRLHLKFLRAENFVPRKAVERMVLYFDWKRELFGDDKICEKITTNDLSAEDLAYFRLGKVQILPSRDRAGRAVIVFIIDDQLTAPLSYGRILYLMSQIDEETERRGVAVVTFNMGKFNMSEAYLSQARMGSKSADAMPARMTSLHQCFTVESYSFGVLVDYVTRLMPKDTRAKVKIHRGSHMENLYALMTYGISDHSIPVSEDGRIKLKNHLDYLEMMFLKDRHDESNEGHEMVTLPLLSDVLLGRGKPIQEHTGNIRLAVMVDDMVPQYNQCSKLGKTQLSVDVVKMVKAASGRFLSKDTGIWMEVSDNVARDKVSHLFRTRRTMMAATKSVASKSRLENTVGYDTSGTASKKAGSTF